MRFLLARIIVSENADRQSDSRIDRQPDDQTDRQIDRQTDRQKTDSLSDREIYTAQHIAGHTN